MYTYIQMLVVSDHVAKFSLISSINLLQFPVSPAEQKTAL